MIFITMIEYSHAETFEIDVRAERTSGIYYFWSYNPTTCYGSPYPKIRLKQPKHGKLTHRKEKARIPKGKPCAGKISYRAVVYYKPDRGFRGKENVSFGFSFLKYRGEMNRQRVNHKGILTVK